MQSTNRPAKFLVPFAQNDSARVEIPATTADATRFSQSLGSPPLTGMPPEAGGVPPQLEDFNGAMNQIARGVWWALGGGRFAYDSDWANNGLIGGYARGAVVPAALGAGAVGLGEWYNNTEGNTADPDTVGTGWVPGYNYGTTALVNQTGGTITLTPAQAAKRKITITGTLTSNLVIVVPNWIYDWNFYNATSGAFTVTVKNAATPGVLVPQNAQATPVHCDGSIVSAFSPNVGLATLPTQPAQFSQTTGRLLNVLRFDASATYTPSPLAKYVIVEAVGGGGAGGGTVAAGAGTAAAGGGGGAGAYFRTRVVVDFSSIAVTVGVGGTGAVGATGGNGSASTFGTASAPGGSPGGLGTAANAFPVLGAVGSGSNIATGANLVVAAGSVGNYSLLLSATQGISGSGGPSVYGGGGGFPQAGSAAGNSFPGSDAVVPGAGGGGALSLSGSSARAGGTGGRGVVLIYEYA